MSHYNQYAPTSPSGAPPPPPPKPYSQDTSRTGTPITAAQPSQQHQHRYSQQYSQPPPLPPTPSQQAQQPQTSPPPQFQQGPSKAPALPSQTHPSHPHAPGLTQQPSGPPLPHAFDLPPDIIKQTTPDLQALLSNPDLITSLSKQHPAYNASLQPLHAQISHNLSLASQVSALEAQLTQLRDQTAQLMLQHTSLQTQWRRKQTEMDQALEPWGPRAMYTRLVAGIAEQEAVVRAIGESFLEGGGETMEYYGDSAGNGKASEKEVTDWIRRIREGSAVLEKRREMRARWDEGRVGGWR